ncbi:unnamed protein product, partial [Amoebophrya sp. A120]
RSAQRPASCVAFSAPGGRGGSAQQPHPACPYFSAAAGHQSAGRFSRVFFPGGRQHSSALLLLGAIGTQRARPALCSCLGNESACRDCAPLSRRHAPPGRAGLPSRWRCRPVWQPASFGGRTRCGYLLCGTLPCSFFCRPTARTIARRRSALAS